MTPGRTVVVGGGAAGIAAARRLHDLGRDVLLLEAGDRLGGRARSVRLDLRPALGDAAGRIVMDEGCGWLHSARRNPWTGIAERAGFTVDRSSPHWGRQWRDLGLGPDEREASQAAMERWRDAAHAALGGPDRPLSDFVAADDPWRPMIEAVSGWANGAALGDVSLHDWAAYEDAATDDNWAVREGYGALVAGHAGAVPVRLGTPVARIDRRGRVLRLHTPGGVVEADAAVVAVPTTVLASGALAFDPPLPDKRDAAADLPLGLADKLFLAVDRPEWPAHSHLVGNPRSAATGSYRLSPFGWPVIEAFFGGAHAEAMEDARAAAAFAVGELAGLLGSDWRRRLYPLRGTGWGREPFIGGSYSHARVGLAGERRTLAAPVEERIFFAGEACHPTDFSTAHGAFETGVAAADAVVSGAAAFA